MLHVGRLLVLQQLPDVFLAVNHLAHPLKRAELFCQCVRPGLSVSLPLKVGLLLVLLATLLGGLAFPSNAGFVDALALGLRDSCQWTRIVKGLVNPNCYEARRSLGRAVSSTTTSIPRLLRGCSASIHGIHRETQHLLDHIKMIYAYSCRQMLHM